MNKVIDQDERRDAAAHIDRAVRMLMAARRMKMPEVAQLADIKLPTLYEKLRGVAPLEYAEIRRIAAAFGMSDVEMLQYAELDAELDARRGPTGRTRSRTWKTADEIVTAVVAP